MSNLSSLPAEFGPTLSPRFVAYVRDYLLDCGVDPDPIFAECGIESRKSEEYDCPLPVQQVATLFELAARYTDNPRIGMNMGQRYHYEGSSLLILAMLAAPSVAEGMKCLSRYDQYVDTGIETFFETGQPTARFGARLIGGEEIRGDQINEYLLVFLAQALFVATRRRIPATEVWFCHSDRQNAAELEAFFGAPVKFGQNYNVLLFDRVYLGERFFSSNALLYEILTNALKTYFSSASQQSGFLDVVCREIIRCGSEESPSADLIASRLAISPRTLRRRLADHGYSFQDAKRLARENRAKYYLSHTSLPLSEIAFELGYSELSAFSRAFRSWVGVTPQAYRSNYRHFLQA
jgi:AraC-like DNA-binding protein